MIRILVVDDHPIVRSGVVGLLETEADFEVVGEAASGEAALELASQASPDVILMDLRMPGMGGVEATRLLASARGSSSVPRVLVFTTYEDDDQILAAIEAGASGYLLKAGPANELAAGVRACAAGQTVLSPTVAAQLVARATGTASDGSGSALQPTLTPRETEILGLVAEGLSNPEIAARLFIGESTVKTHLLHAFEKLAVSDRTRAVMRAMELGILKRV